MKLLRRQFLHLAAGAAALPVLPRIARAQAYPSRPVHWIVSFAAGGPNDIVARIVGQYLSDHLGQQFIIENRPGAGGNVGMQSVLSSAPDGYTIAFVGPIKVRALGVTGAKRVAAIPDVPTIGETVPGYEVSIFYGIAVPRGTPPEIVGKLNQAVNAVLADPKLQARLAELGGEPMPMTPAEFGKLVAEETEKWAKVIRAANIKPE
jgi:tripartite-type tricarboxylate transporter receptor subunit TctC